MSDRLKSLKSTKEIKVSQKIIDQVIGQEDAVKIVKKAALQRRHVLLIGEPGTGKSMLGMALAELLPKEKLVDILAFPNPNDENEPLIRTIAAGQGREIVAKSRLEAMNMFKGQNIIMIALLIFSMIAPWWAFNHYSNIPGGSPLLGGVMFAALFLGGMVFLASFVLFINVGKKGDGKKSVPKIIVDNFDKSHVPFFDATGAHAGALLGDVLHDPFQCFVGSNIYIVEDTSQRITLQSMQGTLDDLFLKHKKDIVKNKENYEAIFLNKNELRVLGELNDSIAPAEVLSCNRQDYDGEVIKLTTSANKEIIVTPEHKIAVYNKGNTEFIEARDIEEGMELVSKDEDTIIDEQDIIATYNEKQQEQCALFHQYLVIRKRNPTWGYKKIAKSMNQPIGKTRWWHANKHIPVPIQTANWLREKDLLPLRINSSRLPLIAKVLGATFGDGGIFHNLNGMFLSSSEIEAVKEFGSDLIKIFGACIDSNHRIIEGGQKGHSWCYQNTNRGVIRFFLALGAPLGNKTNQELRIPSWIYLSGSFKEEFFGSFLGGELGAPKVHKQKNRLQTLDLAITGTSELEQNRINLLNELKKHLEEKDVYSTSLVRRATKNPKLNLYRLLISIKLDNAVNLVKNVKINYCMYKKEKLIHALNELRNLKLQKYNELILRGYGAESIMRLLNLTPESMYLVLNEEMIA